MTAQPSPADAAAARELLRSLIDRRKRHGLSQRQVAKRMGVRQSFVSQIECLGTSPQLSTYQRYAVAVGARIRFVVEDLGGVS